MKLAKRVTGRSEMIAAKNGYHGNIQGAMSVMGYEDRKRAYRPLIPNIKFIECFLLSFFLTINLNSTNARKVFLY